MNFLGFSNYYREFIKGYADKIYPMQKLTRNKGKKFCWTDEAQVSFENIKRELCEAPVLGMPTEKWMFVLDTDASVVAISGILHQEQEWNGSGTGVERAYFTHELHKSFSSVSLELIGEPPSGNFWFVSIKADGGSSVEVFSSAGSVVASNASMPFSKSLRKFSKSGWILLLSKPYRLLSQLDRDPVA